MPFPFGDMLLSGAAGIIYGILNKQLYKMVFHGSKDLQFSEFNRKKVQYSFSVTWRFILAHISLIYIAGVQPVSPHLCFVYKL